uniref:Uncharacterized protein n=1 Tax=Knipowitschia caucasica TaxID=637954 RepID=A0AAV2KAD6_KNICA
MSKGQTLRALVTERLCAAADEIFALFERTITEYEEEIHQYKAENQRKQMLLDSATAIPSSVSVLSEIHHKNHSLKQETSQGNEEETDQLRKLLTGNTHNATHLIRLLLKIMLKVGGLPSAVRWKQRRWKITANKQTS